MKLKVEQLRRSRIEMMPLIDSFFLILVYFIYAFLSMSVHKGIPLDLPQASTSEVSKSTHYAVSVDKQEQYYLDKKPIEKSVLKASLRTLFEKDREAFQLYIFGDQQTPHGEIVFVLNIARELGIEKVLIETNTNTNNES